MNMNRRKGFTLVEVLIVVIILGILAAAIIPQFTSAATDSRENSTALVVKSMLRKASIEKAKNGSFPAAITQDMFEGGELPKNGLFPTVTEPDFMAVETDTAILHPAVKTSDPATDVVWWYNSGNGLVRALLPNTTAAGDVVALYNRVNNTAITAANQTN
jgi:prepilin-type N-terminal cleavage/methylation domain-containing protein